MIYTLCHADGRTAGESRQPIVVRDARYASVGVQWLDPVPGDGSYVEQRADVEADRRALVEQIKQIRDTKTQTGGFPAAGRWFHSDTFSRTQQLGLLLMGPSIPEGLMWKCMDGSFVTMTPTLASQIFAAAAAQDAGMFAHSEALQAQVNAAADPSTVDINAGWPATFFG